MLGVIFKDSHEVQILELVFMVNMGEGEVMSVNKARISEA